MLKGSTFVISFCCSCLPYAPPLCISRVAIFLPQIFVESQSIKQYSNEQDASVDVENRSNKTQSINASSQLASGSVAQVPACEALPLKRGRR